MSKAKSKTSKIEKNVMDRIKKGEIRMKPQSYYLVIGLLSFVSILFLSSISAYAISITTLWIRIEAARGPAYGAKNNLSNLFSLFPWWSLAVGLLSLLLIILMVKKIGSLYKIRLVYLIPSIIFSLLFIGYILSFSSLPVMLGGQRHNPYCSVDDSSCRPMAPRFYRNSK